ncbi:hypothetical protein [Polaromonas sp.]|uniref:hypothetical protein n=1 Tax=Polaromonas sp. TaxID=1869339 RepID=UPI0024885057|nr:hypothetical protein [Polaromonas sp.]MDI1342420.1 hypothetical protein [Polaromonas sp.]
MQKQKAAAEHIRQRLSDNPRLPAATRHVLETLATEAAAPAWDFFEEPELWRVVDRVRQAYEQTLAEIARPSKTHESDDLTAIIKKARDLQSAIKRSSLPGRTAYLDRYELQAEDMPDVPIDVGWHTLPAVGRVGFGYPLAICEVLGWAAELAQEHLDSLPVRSLDKKKGKPEVTAFVRLLAWHFKREFKKEHRTAIAHIATAVFDLSDPLDVKGVDGRLKDRKRPFVAT